MKLRMICENIRKTNFYDFYALAYVYQELQTSTGVDPTYKKEVEQALREVAEYVFNDHMNQIAMLIVGRLTDIEVGNGGNIFVFGDFGIPITRASMDNFDRNNPKNWPVVDCNDIYQLPLRQKGKFVSELLQYRTSSDVTAATNGVWTQLASKFVQLTKTNTNDPNALILAIDKIYGMTHHGGQLLDHFDERDWLEAALNTRTLTSPKNLLFHASPHIRELLTSASIGVPRHEKVPLLQELGVMLTRVAKTMDLFDYSYEIGEDEIGEEPSEFTYSLKMRLAGNDTITKGKAVRLFSWKNYYYREWGELYNHDYSRDKECTQTINGVLTSRQQAGSPPTFTHKILLFDKDGQKISKKPNAWTREFGEITTPHGPIRSTLQFADTMPSVATMAQNLMDSAEHYQEINEMDWQPIQGDPNPP